MGCCFDLRRELVFYGSYHNNKWNILVHAVFVPALALSFAVFGAYSPQLIPYPLRTKLDAFLPPSVAALFSLDAAFVVLASYSLFYTALEPFAGVTWAALQGLPFWLAAEWARQNVPHAWAWAAGVQVVSWWAQVHIGHCILEKRRPALMDGLVQAFLTAPLFVWLELLFAVGYRPTLKTEVQAGVDAAIAEFRSAAAQNDATIQAAQAPLLSADNDESDGQDAKSSKDQ